MKKILKYAFNDLIASFGKEDDLDVIAVNFIHAFEFMSFFTYNSAFSKINLKNFFTNLLPHC